MGEADAEGETEAVGDGESEAVGDGETEAEGEVLWAQVMVAVTKGQKEFYWMGFCGLAFN